MLSEILIQKKRDESLVIFLSSIFVLLIATHFSIISETVDAVLLFLIIPLIIGVLILKKDLTNFGFNLGNLKIGLVAGLFFSLVAIILVYLAVRYSAHLNMYYANEKLDLKIVIETIIYMFSWEFFLRGFLLFGLKDNIGPVKANIVQTLLFFISHWHKAPLEFYSTLATGMLFGYIAFKSRSFWPIALIHTVIYISVVFFTIKI
jgi:membrane protease YdiL (CAAX protease family)